jgi:glycosyltransferase involved in cell wall biosynthesis
MRILQVINRLDYGGAEKLIFDLIPFILSIGHKVDILVFGKSNSNYDTKMQEMGINIIYTGNGQSVYNPIHIGRIRKIIKGYDVVHVHLFPAQYWVSIASRLTGKPPKLFTTEHSTHNKRMNYAILRPLERFIYKRYDKIVSISAGTNERISTWLGLPMDRFTIIENGVDFDQYDKARSYNRGDFFSGSGEVAPILLIMVARFGEQKDQLTLLRAMRLLDQKYKLLLVGDGDRRAIYEQFCEENGLMERVRFLGFREDIGSLLKSADISVLSSHWEGFGLAALEAMASGTPVLASDVQGLRDVVINAGLLFRAGDHHDLAAKLLELEGNPGLRQKIISDQFSKVKQFDIKEVANKYVILYSHP